jgi:maleylacetate reductase
MQAIRPGIHHFPAIERVVFGQPAAEAVSAEVQRAGARRVMLLVSSTLNRSTDEVRKIERALGDKHAKTVDGVPQHTTRTGVSFAVNAAMKANADLLVAIGGGSVIDAAKMVTLCMRHNMVDEHLEKLDEFEIKIDESGRVVLPAYEGPSVRMIAVPSTLNGGEYNSGCLVTDTRRKHKQTFGHPLMVPKAIVLPSDITGHTPPTLWLGSATRALDHAIEALLSNTSTPLADAVVLDGIARMVRSLRAWKNDPDSTSARAECQVASWLCSFGISSRGQYGGVMMGLSHAVGHVLGGTCGVPHYFCTPVLMPSVLRWLAPATADKQRLLARALGIEEASAADAFGALVKELGLPASLKEVNVEPAQFEQIAKLAMHEIFIRGSARQVEGPQDIVGILRMAA